jgi:hypothetical protein
LTIEYSSSIDQPASAELGIVPLSASSYLPGWAAGSPAILGFFEPGATSTCVGADGVSVSVVGHPEATVIYNGNTTLTATDSTGIVGIIGLASPGPVQMNPTKTGCSFQLEGSNLTKLNEFPLANDAVTVVAVKLK